MLPNCKVLLKIWGTTAFVSTKPLAQVEFSPVNEPSLARGEIFWLPFPFSRWFLIHNVFPPGYWHSRLENPLDSNLLVRVPGRVHVLHYRGREMKQLLSHFWDFTAMSVPGLYLHSLEVSPAGQHLFQPVAGSQAWCWCGVWVPADLRGGPEVCPGELCTTQGQEDVKRTESFVMWCDTYGLFSSPLSPMSSSSTWITLSKVPSPMANCANTGSQVFNVTQKGLSDGLPYSLSLVVNTTHLLYLQQLNSCNILYRND